MAGPHDLLVELARHDLEVRARLAADGRLFDGYHPEMQAVHEANADALAAVVEQHGWPDMRVAPAAAEAAWLIAQHAIGRPAFQRDCLRRLEAAAAKGAVPAWQPAMLLDRIRVLEGRPQVYGCSFDWDDDGLMSPLPIEDAEAVEARRAAVGLPTLAATTARIRAESAGEPRPPDPARRRREMDDWARSVGWRTPARPEAGPDSAGVTPG
jgi:hypothetical protein